ncbi:MAG TPA: hypothetical protein VFS81_16170, partial [Candidatus Binatia bacterium]|nr:hypothetical protein [Candidatus Binatia bacterium]
ALVGYRAAHLRFISRFDNRCRLIVNNLEMSNAAGRAYPLHDKLNRRFNSFGRSCHSFSIEAVRRNGNCISAARLEWDCLLGKEEQSPLVVFGLKELSPLRKPSIT